MVGPAMQAGDASCITVLHIVGLAQGGLHHNL